MNRKNWRIVGRFALLILIQLLVLNNVPLNAYMPRLYLYLLAILMLPTDMKRIPMLLTAFGTGLLMDIMDTSPLGFQALACSIVVMMRILFVDRILTRGESTVISTPSIYSVSLQYFISYLLILFAAFYLVFFTVGQFGFSKFGGDLMATVASTVATVLLALLYQFIFLKKETI